MDEYSDNLSINDAEIISENIKAKVAAQKNALGFSGGSVAYYNAAGHNMRFNTVRPVNPLSDMDIELVGDPSAGTPNGRITWNFLIQEHQFTYAGAAGVIGNLMQESGINPKSHQHGGGPGRGIMQWTVNERWASLLSWAQKQNLEPLDLITQLKYMIVEMQRQKYKGAPVYQFFKNVKNLKEATLVFERTMERAGKPMMERRYKYAEDAFASYSEWSRDENGNIKFRKRSLDHWGEKYG